MRGRHRLRFFHAHCFKRLKSQQFSVTIGIGRVSPPQRLQMFMFPHDFHWPAEADELDQSGRASMTLPGQ
jgi:hypothetical protein